MSTSLRAIAQHDEAVDEGEKELNFYVLEGTCRKCLLGPNTLVIYDFKVNTRDRTQSIFKTQCIACGHQAMHYSASIEKGAQ